MSEIKLGSNRRNLDLNTVKAEIKRSNIQDEAQLKIFDALNKNVKGKSAEILDAKELGEALTELLELSGEDAKLGKRDAKAFFKKYNLENISQEDLFKFIEQLSNSDGNIVQAEKAIVEGEEVVLVTKEDEVKNENGTRNVTTTQEQINPDGEIKNNVITKTNFSAEGLREDENIVTPDGITNRFYINDAGEIITDERGIELLQYETFESADGTYKSQTTYENGLPTEIIENFGKTKEVKSEFLYDKDGNPILNENGEHETRPTLEITNKGLPKEQKTFYNYNDDGSYSTDSLEVSSKGLKTGVTTEYDADGNRLSERKVNDTGTRERTFNKDGSFNEFFVTKNGVTQETEYNADGKRLTSTVEDNAGSFTLNYDGNGNTKGIIVQFDRKNPETNIKDFCKKFNIDEQAFKELNGIADDQKTLAVGQEVSVPTELEPYSADLRKRDSAEVALKKKANHDAYVAKMAEFRQEAADRTPVTHKLDINVNEKLRNANEFAAYLYKQEGNSQVTKEQLDIRAKQLIQDNPERFDKKTGKYIYAQDSNGLVPISKQPLKLRVNADLAKKWGVEVSRKKDLSTQTNEHSQNNRSKYLAYQFGASNSIKNRAPRNGEERLDTADVFKKLFKEINNGKASITGFIDGVGVNTLCKERGAIGEKNFASMMDRLARHSSALGLNHKDLISKIKTSTKKEEMSAAMGQIMRDIHSIEALPASQRAEYLKKTQLTAAGVGAVADVGERNLNEAKGIMHRQERADSWASEFAEFVSGIYSSKNRKGVVNAEFAEFQHKLRRVQDAYTQTRLETSVKTPAGKQVDDSAALEAFSAKFKEEFGRDFDPRAMNIYGELNRKFQTSIELDQASRVFANHENWSADKMRSTIKEYFGKTLSKDQLAQFDNMSKADMRVRIDNFIDNLRAEKGDTLSSSSQLLSQMNEIGHNLFGTEFNVVERANNYAASQQAGEKLVLMAPKMAGYILTGPVVGYGVANAIDAANDLTRDETRLNEDGTEKSFTEQFDAVFTKVVTEYAKTNAVDAALFAVGGEAYSAIQANVKGVLKQAAVGLTADVAIGAGAELITTGDVSAQGTITNAIIAALGHGTSSLAALKGKGAKAAPNKAPAAPEKGAVRGAIEKGATGMTRQGTEEILGASQVHFGAKRAPEFYADAERILADVEKVANNPNATQAEINAAINNLNKLQRHADSYSNAHFRKQVQARADEIGKKFGPKNEAVYKAQKFEQLEADVDVILTRGKRVEEPQVRKFTEYANKLDDVEQLKQLKTDIQNKGIRDGILGHDLNKLERLIDDRIKAINLKNTSNAQLLSDVENLLGPNTPNLSSTREVMELISRAETLDDLARIENLIERTGNKKLGGSGNRRAFNKAIDARHKALSDNLAMHEPTPVVQEPPKVEVKAETPVETPVEVKPEPETPARKTSNERYVDSHTIELDGVQGRNLDGVPEPEFRNVNTKPKPEPKATVENATPGYSTDANGHVLPENYSKMTNDELVAEYRRLSEYESTGDRSWSEPSPSGKVWEINSHDMYSNKSAIKDLLKERGMQLTRKSVAGSEIPEYGFKPVKVNSAEHVAVRNRAVSELTDAELAQELQRLRTTRQYRNPETGKFELVGNHKNRFDEIVAEANKRGLKVDNYELVGRPIVLEPVEIIHESVNVNSAEPVAVRNRAASELTDAELTQELQRLRSTRQYRNPETGKFELVGNHKSRFDEIVAEANNRGMKVENYKLVEKPIEVEPVEVRNVEEVPDVEILGVNKATAWVDVEPIKSNVGLKLERQIDNAITLRDLTNNIEPNINRMPEGPEKEALLAKLKDKKAEIRQRNDAAAYVNQDNYSVIDISEVQYREQQIIDDVNNNIIAVNMVEDPLYIEDLYTPIDDNFDLGL